MKAATGADESWMASGPSGWSQSEYRRPQSNLTVRLCETAMAIGLQD